jgi:N6-adenosine-specific RNA methylase IME4
MGVFPRPQHEILMVCRRGPLAFSTNDVGSVQDWKQDYSLNGGKHHSRKPDAALDLIERVSPGPYLELFARRQRLGWSTWGNEALEHVSLEVPS